MKNNIIKEVVVSVLLILLAILLLNPFHFWMPDMMVVGVLVFALLLFGLFAGLIMKEDTFDERDSVNRSLAGRNAFLSGLAILMLGIMVEGYSHSIDSWLVVALVVMIVTKMATRIWIDKNL